MTCMPELQSELAKTGRVMERQAVALANENNRSARNFAIAGSRLGRCPEDVEQLSVRRDLFLDAKEAIKTNRAMKRESRVLCNGGSENMRGRSGFQERKEENSMFIQSVISSITHSGSESLEFSNLVLVGTLE